MTDDMKLQNSQAWIQSTVKIKRLVQEKNNLQDRRFNRHLKKDWKKDNRRTLENVYNKPRKQDVDAEHFAKDNNVWINVNKKSRVIDIMI